MSRYFKPNEDHASDGTDKSLPDSAAQPRIAAAAATEDPPSASPSLSSATSASTSSAESGFLPQLSAALSSIASHAGVWFNAGESGVSNRDIERIHHQQSLRLQRDGDAEQREEQRNEAELVTFWAPEAQQDNRMLSRTASQQTLQPALTTGTEAEEGKGASSGDEKQQAGMAVAQSSPPPPLLRQDTEEADIRPPAFHRSGSEAAATQPGLSRGSSLHLSSIADDDVRALLDPDDNSASLLSMESWDDEKLQRLIAVLEPVHLPVLLRKAAAVAHVHAAASLSFQNLSYVEGGAVRLSSVSGYLLPGMLVGVLGAPDAGVTTLLNVLTGRQRGGRLHGEVLVNGRPPTVGFERQIGYVVKDDLNLPALTVAETLMFSAQLRQSRQPLQLTRLRVAVVMKMLGLAHTANTVVGDGITRGISGGEKRRVSYACEVVAGHQIIIADLPTNGLDSASAFSLISNVKYANKAGRSMLTSLVQPSPELFALLDFVLLLSKGSCLYFGPASHVQGFLSSQGFEQTRAQQSLPEFLEELSAQPERYWVNRNVPYQLTMQSKFAPHNFTVGEETEMQMLGAGQQQLSSPVSPLSPAGPEVALKVERGDKELQPRINEERLAAWKRLVQGFKESEYHQDVGVVLFRQSLDAVVVPSAPSSLLSRVAGVLSLRGALGDGELFRYNSSFPQQLSACLRRQALLTFRNRGLWIGNWVKSVIIGLIIGSLFLQVGTTQADTRTRFGLFYFMLSFHGNSAVQMVSVLMGSRQVYYNQVAAAYFNGFAYYISCIVVQLPIVLVESFLFIVISYPLVGLYGGVGSTAFLYTWCMLLLVDLVARSWVLFLSCISPTQEIASILVPISNVLFSVFSGYLAPANSIPIGWRWMYDISYYTYAIRGLAINGIWNLTFSCPAGEQCAVTDGPSDLALYDMDGSYSERFTDLLNLVWFFISFNVGAAVAMVVLNFSHQDAAEPPSFIDDSAPKLAQQRSLPPGVDSKAVLTQSKAFLEFKQLCYSVPVPRKKGEKGQGKTVDKPLLNNVFGYCKPGIMVALMGASGAGKSTLLDVLAGKKTGGTITGDILVNGRPRDASFSRIAGYVEQFDSLVGTATVRESVEFSAALRLPAHLTPQERQRKVDNVLSVLGLTHLQHERIGNSETGGVSPEVRKKVTIAVELIMDPSLLFLDEPTTGLDGVGAAAVMTAVRELAREISVMCTIHQPSAEIVHMFDYLCLMKAGGEVAYFGPITELSAYLDSQGFGRCPEGRNIADFALEAVKFAATGRNYRGEPLDLSAAFLSSPNAKPVLATLSEGLMKDEDERDLRVIDERDLPSFGTQLRMLTARFCRDTLRKRGALIARYVVPVFMGFLIGTLFFQLGLDQVDASNRVSVMFLSLLFAVFSAGSQLPAVFQMRPIYFREHSSNMYTAAAYFAARFLADVPFVLSEMFIYSVMVYWIAGLTDADNGLHFFLFLLCFWGARWAGITFTQLCGSLFGTLESANGLQSALLTVFMLFCGFLISKGNIPSGWIWMYYLSFLRYPLDFLIANEVLDQQYVCSASQLLTTYVSDNLCPSDGLPEGGSGQISKCPIACGKELMSQYQIDYSNADIALNLGLTFVWASGFLVLGYLALRYINHIKR